VLTLELPTISSLTALILPTTRTYPTRATMSWWPTTLASPSSASVPSATTCQDMKFFLCKVYHVPELNAPLFSIPTHRRRGPGCSLIANHLGCWLTFPTFILDIHDAKDFLLTITPSDPNVPIEYAEPVSIPRQLKTARRLTALTSTSCRRSRVPEAIFHLLPDPSSTSKPAPSPDIPTI
jgi:hypothetical protein